MYIAYSPYLPKDYKSPISVKFVHSLFPQKFAFWGLIYVFCFPLFWPWCICASCFTHTGPCKRTCRSTALLEPRRFNKERLITILLIFLLKSLMASAETNSPPSTRSVVVNRPFSEDQRRRSALTALCLVRRGRLALIPSEFVLSQRRIINEQGRCLQSRTIASIYRLDLSATRPTDRLTNWPTIDWPLV